MNQIVTNEWKLKMLTELPRIYFASSRMIPNPARTASKMLQYIVVFSKISDWLEPIYFAMSVKIALAGLIKAKIYH